MPIIYLILAFCLTLLLRILPLLNQPHRGCDAYYFLLCAEEFRKNKKLPIILTPYYLLEYQEQWYPPGFVLFLGLLPKKFVEKYYWLISPFIDSLIGVLVGFVSFLLLKNIQASIIAILIYAFSYSVFSETKFLTSRQLGNLLLNISVFGLFWGTSANNFLGHVLFFIFGFFVLMTHKMATQNIVISLFFLSLFMKDIKYILFLLALFAFTFVASKGFYLKIFRAHLDIISFWGKNWNLLGAHQIYNSPIYGDPKKYKNVLYHPANMFNYLILMLLTNALIFFIIFENNVILENNVFLNQAFFWMISTYTLSYLVTLIPYMRLIGEGYKYIKFAIPSISILGGVLFIKAPRIILVIIIFYAFIYMAWYFRERKKSLVGSVGVADSNFLAISEYFKKTNNPKIICIPNHLSDALAYYTRNQVFWGTHNYPFKWIKNFFPVWRKKLSYFIRVFKLTHLLIDRRYVNPEIFTQEVKKCLCTAGNYSVYEL